MIPEEDIVRHLTYYSVSNTIIYTFYSDFKTQKVFNEF